MEKCYICPRKCGINRSAATGVCGVGEEIRIGRVAPHLWEEPSISGKNGSGTIFFAGCNLKCVYCQNEKLSRAKVGQPYTQEEVVEAMLKLQQEGVHNINLVTPTHYISQIAECLLKARKQGLRLPIVYNTSGYESVESLRTLEGLVDIYMPDFKYISEEPAEKYSRAKDYPEVVKKAIEEMVRQVGKPVFDEEEMLLRGVLVRHLVLPGQIEESKKVLQYLHETYEDRILISIMNQYTPVGNLEAFPELQRRITEEEYDEVIDYAIEIGIEEGYIQEGETAMESFIPEFS